jgi:proteasome accessory factor A
VESLVKPRIFGIETEYGLTAKVGPSWGLTSETAFSVIQHLFETIDLRSTNRFLENGARLYLDGGDHPEYATPECDDVMELVAHDKAGERILEERLRRAEQRLGEEGTPVRIRLFKNNTDSARNYYGCHENYLVKRDVDFARLSTALVPFLVTRQIFAGAGKAYQTCDGIEYCLSQRGQRPVFEGAATPYPVIDTRDQPLADATRYRRLHVVIGDANMSEVATYLKVGTTALLLDMVEDGVFGPDLTLQSATSAIHDISGDAMLRRTVTLQDGRRFTALELQMEYLEQATRYVGSIGASAKARDLLCRWADVLSKLAADPMLLERQVDWVTKWALMEKFIGHHQLSWQDPKVGLLDLQYHDLRREEGIYARLVSRGAVDRMVDDHAVVHAQRNPPPTTRARLRGDFIRNANLSGTKCQVDWTYMRLTEDPEEESVSCSDPFRAFDERVESLVRRMHLKADLRQVEGARDGESVLAALTEQADRRGQSDEVEAAGRGTSDAHGSGASGRV